MDLKSRKNPVATVCNYVFDSLRQDAFRVKDDILYENRCDAEQCTTPPAVAHHTVQAAPAVSGTGTTAVGLGMQCSSSERAH